MSSITVRDINKRIARDANSKRAEGCLNFFKTGPGQYGEGDIFIGITVPQARTVAKEFRGASMETVEELLSSKIHEERLVALLIWNDQFERGDESTQKDIYNRYLANTRHINNWDLVDVSAYKIVGPWLFERSRKPLYKLAKSKSLWEQRIAVVATFHFLKREDFDDLMAISDILLKHEHDLIHKAVGWMLREAGKKDRRVLVDFLSTRYNAMPRTMLRYAIERFPEDVRKKYLAGRI